METGYYLDNGDKMKSNEYELITTCYDLELSGQLIRTLSQFPDAYLKVNDGNKKGIVEQIGGISIGTDFSILFSLCAGFVAFIKIVRPIIIELIKRKREVKIKYGDTEISVNKIEDLEVCIKSLSKYKEEDKEFKS